MSADYRHWFLLNAAPDIRSQIETFPGLWPHIAGAVRHTPIQGVLLTDAEIDHTLGLLVLRETSSVRVYATDWVHTALMTSNPLLRTLAAYCEVDWQPLEPGKTIGLQRSDGMDSGITCTPFSTHGAKPPAFAAGIPADAQTTVGLRLTDQRTGGVLVYAPSVFRLSDEVLKQICGSTCLLFDGTCWCDDELPALGIAAKTARAMGHVPVDGTDGSLAQLATLAIDRTLYIHVNNTNPLLIDDSPERRAVEACGIEVASDGMQLEV